MKNRNCQGGFTGIQWQLHVQNIASVSDLVPVGARTYFAQVQGISFSAQIILSMQGLLFSCVLLL